jgi:hypothetical protein
MNTGWTFRATVFFDLRTRMDVTESVSTLLHKDQVKLHVRQQREPKHVSFVKIVNCIIAYMIATVVLVLL